MAYPVLSSLQECRFRPERLGKTASLVRAPAHVTGPWFFGRGLRPVDGFPGADTTHTTFRHEGSIAGYAAFAMLGLMLAGY
ncbi:hypothetical protein [Cupriavidus necator]|uniref:hypothetical protein n=1 Tax=Cupriavidus necator TaxID=106590 RepID=UPI0012D30DE1|nr:hypothetical protein [Cupriavidus necator]